MPRKSTGLIDRALWGDLLHEFSFSTVRTDREPTAYDLTEAGNVGYHPVNSLGAPQRSARQAASGRMRFLWTGFEGWASCCTGVLLARWTRWVMLTVL